MSSDETETKIPAIRYSLALVTTLQ